MRVLTIEELMFLTRVELTCLLARIKGVLAELPDDCENREVALACLRNIRYVLARREPRPD